MAPRIIELIFGGEQTRSVLGDLRSGRAGLWLRLGLSVASAALCLVPGMAVLGAVEISGSWVRDEHVAFAIASAGVLWFATLVPLWWSFRRYGRIVRTAVFVVGVWIVVLPTAVGIAEVSRADYMIGAVVLLGVAVTLGLVATGAYRAGGGRPVRDAIGRIDVNCPQCNYSLVGLESCTCPECGYTSTIDALIDAQDYGVLRETSYEAPQLPHPEADPPMAALPAPNPGNETPQLAPPASELP